MLRFPDRERARWAVCAVGKVWLALGVSTSQLTLGRSPGDAAAPLGGRITPPSSRGLDAEIDALFPIATHRGTIRCQPLFGKPLAALSASCVPGLKSLPERDFRQIGRVGQQSVKKEWPQQTERYVHWITLRQCLCVSPMCLTSQGCRREQNLLGKGEPDRSRSKGE
jgi:hypothetical protein